MNTAPGERPWLDSSLEVERRVDALLARMTLAEKVGQTNQVANIDPGSAADDQAIRSGRVGSSLYASGATAGNERDKGLRVESVDHAQRVAVEESRLGIPVLFGRDVIHGHRTVFPIPLGLAASFDEGLVERTATIAGGRRRSTASRGPSRPWSTSRRIRAGGGWPSRSARTRC